MQKFTATSRTQVKRQKIRASYERVTIYAALDGSLMATIAFVDQQQIHAIPTLIWREHDHLYVHGSNGSRLIKILQAGQQVCVSVTHLHGMVLARAAPPHSVNYTSVNIYGAFENVSEDSKMMHMQTFFEHWLPGRWQHLRLPNKKELAATAIMRIHLTEAVLKSRQGPPKDDESDLGQSVWAGVIPLAWQWQLPQQVLEQGGRELPGKLVREFYMIKQPSGREGI